MRVTSTASGSATAESPTFVLVHGIGMSHRYLERLASQLSVHGTVHSLDLPGFGGITHPADPLVVQDHARLIGDVLDQIGVSQAVLVGHSMGAQFVTELARTRPELASSVVLMGPVTDPDRATAIAQGRDLAVDALGETPLGNLLTISDYIRCGPRWFFTTLPAMLDYRTDLALASVVAPVLVLRGINDPVARVSWCLALAAAAPDGEMREIAHSRHLVHFTAARQTAAAILEFLRRSARVEPELAV
jgi:pimeloyl-ACP methyl ester carboxylesterase